MGASESTTAKNPEPTAHDDHHGHNHGPGGHSHSHGGSATSTTTTTTTSRIPGAMTAEQLRAAPGIIPQSHVTIPAGGAQWQQVPVTHGPAPTTAAAVDAAGPVIHPDPAAAAHTHHTHYTHHHPHGHHPQAAPTGVAATAATLASSARLGAAAPPASQGAGAAPVVSGGGFAPTKATAPHMLPETGHVQPLKGVEFVPSGPLPTTTPGAPLTTVHTQAAAAPPTLRAIDVVSVPVTAVDTTAVAASKAAEMTTAPVVNPSLLPPASTSTPTKVGAAAAGATPSRTGGAARSLPTGSKDVWDQLLRWASPLLPQGAAAQWDARGVSDAVLAVPSAEPFRAALQLRQLERKKRRKAQALENAEAAAAGKKVPLTSPTAASAPVIRGQSGQSLSIPYEIASVLLSVDKALSAMRLQWVPSRVSEDTFFVEYFTAVVRALHGEVEEREPAAAAEVAAAKPANTSVLEKVRAIDNATEAQRQSVQ